MLKCIHCQVELPAWAAFCPACGKLGRAAEPKAQIAGPAEPVAPMVAPRAAPRALHPLLQRPFHDTVPPGAPPEQFARRLQDSVPPPASALGRELPPPASLLGRELPIERRGPAPGASVPRAAPLSDPVAPAPPAEPTVANARLAGSKVALPGEGVRLPDSKVVNACLAPLWRRLLAWGIDLAALLVVAALFLGLAAALVHHGPSSREGGLDYLAETALAYRPLWLPGALLVLLLSVSYLTLFTMLGGPTPGKRLLGLTVIDRSGRCPGPTRSAVRSMLAVVSGAFAFVGFSWLFFDRRRQALHDKLAGTFVVLAKLPAPVGKALSPSEP